MAKFFRSIRQLMLSESKFSKYLLYAIGEIVLVVIGILIALSINNWNEQRKANKNEIVIFNSFLTSIDGDLHVYNGIFDYRLGIKKNAIDSLKKLIGTQEKVSDSIFMSYYKDIDRDIVGRFDSGPYDALKSNGLNQISNPGLRKDIVNTYQAVMPAYINFLSIPSNEFNTSITELENQFLESKVIPNKSSGWEFISLPSSDAILSDMRFIRVLNMQEEKYFNYTYRLEDMKEILTELRGKIVVELNKKLNNGI